jgi:dihydrofolate reductase
VRKIISSLFISLDGVVEAPNEWQFGFDDEMGVAMNKMMASADTVLLGRVTYTQWVGYWPTVTSGDDVGYANWINNAPKYVASSTLNDVDDWPKSTLVKDLAATAERLKAGEGKDIAVTGSPGVVRSLLGEGLLDELMLLIQPVIAGGGRMKLFDDDAALTRLELVNAQSTSGGVVIATYRPAR